LRPTEFVEDMVMYGFLPEWYIDWYRRLARVIEEKERAGR
jgi:hypothetical protein